MAAVAAEVAALLEKLDGKVGEVDATLDVIQTRLAALKAQLADLEDRATSLISKEVRRRVNNGALLYIMPETAAPFCGAFVAPGVALSVADHWTDADDAASSGAQTDVPVTLPVPVAAVDSTGAKYSLQLVSVDKGTRLRVLATDPATRPPDAFLPIVAGEWGTTVTLVAMRQWPSRTGTSIGMARDPTPHPTACQVNVTSAGDTHFETDRLASAWMCGAGAVLLNAHGVTGIMMPPRQFRYEWPAEVGGAGGAGDVTAGAGDKLDEGAGDAASVSESARTGHTCTASRYRPCSLPARDNCIFKCCSRWNAATGHWQDLRVPVAGLCIFLPPWSTLRRQGRRRQRRRPTRPTLMSPCMQHHSLLQTLLPPSPSQHGIQRDGRACFPLRV